MKYKEFLEYMEKYLESYNTFMRKANQFQIEKNLKRPAKSRWSDEKVEKATYDMWKAAMEPLYNKLKNEIKSDFRESWISFIDKNELLENINEGISQLDFNEVA
ncbi:hypothetical protein [Lacrimispora sp.]|uniref:hypothetical protein n=1 Tax=Lacrimispora sp. TaxID=2719234 RepID=UPI003995451B